MIPLIPIAVAGGVVYLWKKAKNKGMTPARQKLFEEALRSLRDPVKLRLLADSYEKEGLKKEAVQLRQRAQLIELPPEHKRARNQAFREALKSGNADAVQKMAETFHAQGATGSAAKLYQHAAALRQIAQMQAQGAAQKMGEEEERVEDTRFDVPENHKDRASGPEEAAAVAEMETEDAGDPVVEGGPLSDADDPPDPEREENVASA